MVKGVDAPALLWHGEGTCQVLFSLLGFPVKERHGSTGESPVKGYRDGEGTGLKHLSSYEEWLSELDLFSLKKMFTSLSIYKYLKDT